ncbi:hypothetical protein BU23DRAFT_571374 [Bimuria novae-zelandiae CBS 107.79]|uniref:Uncharacterized protein n=1 Tax=Bimuria novae-zelandiae CBS 107.79 TaxID=1447943 RepID=A0A6A5UYY7_9PLEO|nr:hypothetical protein BU23DRAFT_571374 [Bimuria novae-zelandiae CBS 107.79]
MYWTTPTIKHPKPILPPPLSTQLPTSKKEYIRTLKALMRLIHPISAQLLPLLRVYYCLHQSLQARQPSILQYLVDGDDDEFVLMSLHAHIALLLQEAENHYNDFREMYGDCGVGDVLEMLNEMSPEEHSYCANVPRDWDDFTYLMEDAGLQRFRNWKAQPGDLQAEGLEASEDTLGWLKSVTHRAGGTRGIERSRSVVKKIEKKMAAWHRRLDWIEGVNACIDSSGAIIVIFISNLLSNQSNRHELCRPPIPTPSKPPYPPYPPSSTHPPPPSPSATHICLAIRELVAELTNLLILFKQGGGPENFPASAWVLDTPLTQLLSTSGAGAGTGGPGGGSASGGGEGQRVDVLRGHLVLLRKEFRDL